MHSPLSETTVSHLKNNWVYTFVGLSAAVLFIGQMHSIVLDEVRVDFPKGGLEGGLTGKQQGGRGGGSRRRTGALHFRLYKEGLGEGGAQAPVGL